MTPKISMSLSAHYTTQASAYDRLLHGPVLTDKRITQLRREGRYGQEAKLRQLAEDKVGKAAKDTKGKRRPTVDQLLLRYNI